MTTESAEEPIPILLVDDDPSSLAILRQNLVGEGYRILISRSGDDALKVVHRSHPLVVLLDIMMPGMDGYETCRRLKDDPETAGTAVIFLSALEETRDKVRGLELGAVDFISKPFQGEEVVARVRAHVTIQRLRHKLEALVLDLARELAVAQQLLSEARRRVEGPLLGESAAVRALREMIGQYAATTDPLLLTGTHGSGHEAVARAIHHASARSAQAFLHVNCGLLSAGQEPGLLPGTSGDNQPMSLWEMAEHGTLFLEEPQRLPADTQERLTGIIAGEGKWDVRLIAYSSAPGGFHPKLSFQLESRQLRVPSLAERSDDIPELARFFVQQNAHRVGSVVQGIGEESMKRLRRYRWPGGVQELQSLMERAVTSAQGPLIEVDEALLDEGLPLGSYRLVKKLGEGGMGEVWRARHHLLARPCAVKLIRPQLLGEENRQETLERFRREARTIARLSSPNTVTVYDFGVSETGSPYFVMELLDGMDLFSLVQRFGPLPPERAVHVLRQTCRSLAEAHGAGVIHRDIKPQNLFLCRLGVDSDLVKVLDFGLACSFREEDDHITRAGALTGTPAYMPPERATGEQADERSDLYSLGCVAFYMLTGEPVFAGEPMAVMLKHVRTAPRAPSAAAKQRIPEDLDRIVLTCLEKDPEKRPASAIELWRQLSASSLSERWPPESAEQWWRDHAPSPARSPAEDSDSANSLPNLSRS
ncbi:MAG TPA: protein kinase [Candidatus Acidoferrales bacterium]|nr:protein kinase [Candidatus Acidoferrales bacterium]